MDKSVEADNNKLLSEYYEKLKEKWHPPCPICEKPLTPTYSAITHDGITHPGNFLYWECENGHRPDLPPPNWT